MSTKEKRKLIESSITKESGIIGHLHRPLNRAVFVRAYFEELSIEL